MSITHEIPFDLENDELISMESKTSPRPFITNPQPTFVASKDNTASSTSSNINVSASSLFDVVNEEVKPESNLNQNDDPPLLEDIGIDIQLIKKRVIAVLTLQSANQQLISNPDLSGPILISFLLGFLLLFGGKMHFSDIQTAFVIGNILLYLLFNFMNKNPETIPLYNIMSFLGYSLLPMLILAIFGIFILLNGFFGVLCSIFLAAWSSYSCCSAFSMIISRQDSKMLISYPLFLFYVSFALIIIF